MAPYISVAAAGGMSLSLSMYAELDNKLASCNSVITSKCLRVSAVNYPLPMFMTNSGLCTIIWLHKCSTLLCVISTIHIIPFHIFAKWPKWHVVTITVWRSLKNIMMGSHTNAVNTKPALRNKSQQYNSLHVGSFFPFFSFFIH